MSTAQRDHRIDWRFMTLGIACSGGAIIVLYRNVAEELFAIRSDHLSRLNDWQRSGSSGLLVDPTELAAIETSAQRLLSISLELHAQLWIVVPLVVLGAFFMCMARAWEPAMRRLRFAPFTIALSGLLLFLSLNALTAAQRQLAEQSIRLAAVGEFRAPPDDETLEKIVHVLIGESLRDGSYDAAIIEALDAEEYWLAARLLSIVEQLEAHAERPFITDETRRAAHDQAYFDYAIDEPIFEGRVRVEKMGEDPFWYDPSPNRLQECIRGAINREARSAVGVICQIFTELFEAGGVSFGEFIGITDGVTKFLNNKDHDWDSFRFDLATAGLGVVANWLGSEDGVAIKQRLRQMKRAAHGARVGGKAAKAAKTVRRVKYSAVPTFRQIARYGDTVQERALVTRVRGAVGDTLFVVMRVVGPKLRTTLRAYRVSKPAIAFAAKVNDSLSTAIIALLGAIGLQLITTLSTPFFFRASQRLDRAIAPRGAA